MRSEGGTEIHELLIVSETPKVILPDLLSSTAIFLNMSVKVNAKLVSRR